MTEDNAFNAADAALYSKLLDYRNGLELWCCDNGDFHPENPLPTDPPAASHFAKVWFAVLALESLVCPPVVGWPPAVPAKPQPQPAALPPS